MDAHAEKKAKKEKKREEKREELKNKKREEHNPSLVIKEKIEKKKISRQNIFIMVGIIVVVSAFVFFNMN